MSQPSGLLKLNDEMDEKIGKYSKLLETVSDSERPNLQTKLLSAKLMKEKLIAMTALAKAQTILAEMDVLAAESNLKSAIEQLDKFTKDHSAAPPVAKKKSSSDRHDSTKHKTQKVPITPASTVKNNTKTIESNKENTNIQTTGKKKSASPVSVDSQKVQKQRSSTPTETNKRRRSDSSLKGKTEKKAKLAHDSSPIPTANSKSTLLGNSLSPITKTMCVTKSVQTDRQNSEYTKGTEFITNRIIDDDENTVLIEDFSVDRSTHRDAINLSKALQKVMPQKTERYASDLRQELSQSPVLSQIQLLFEDDPAAGKKGKSSAVNVKAEVQDSDPLNNSTENLVNGLFKDIMHAKLKHAASGASSSSNTMSGASPFCKVMLREILEQC